MPTDWGNVYSAWDKKGSHGWVGRQKEGAYFDGLVINRIDAVDAQTDADQHKDSAFTP